MVAAVAVVWAGCGVGVAPGQTYEGPGGQAQIIGTPMVKERRLLPTTVQGPAAVEKRTSVRGSFDVAVPGAFEGARLSVMAGFAGCGISVEAVGTALIRNGRAQVRLNGRLAADDIRQVFITIDDGDGQCTEADTLWTALLTTGQDDVNVTLDLEELEAGPSWMCFSANEP